MGRASTGRRQQRKARARRRSGAARLLLAVAAVWLCAPLLIEVPRAAAQTAGGLDSATEVSWRDIAAALAQMDDLGAFYTAFAARDTNGFARERWRRLGVNYPGTAAILRELTKRDLLLIDDLPEGRSSALLDRGEIVIDRDLDGRWGSGLRRGAGDGTAVAMQRRDLLLPELMQALARRQLSQDWPWLADHLRAVGGLAELAADPVARPLLARFFQAKDAYLWLAMQRVGEGDPAARQALARRQSETFNAIRALSSEMAATFGAAPAERLQRDWAEYVALVDGFAVTRGWVLLDPALRQTHIGAAARREADTVNDAAAEVVALAPRSALAAARSEFGRPAPAAAPTPELRGAQSVNLGEVLAQSQTIAGNPPPAVAELAARLPLETLAMRPELSGSATNPAAFRAFAESLRAAAEQPDPRQIIAERELQLGAAREEVATLKSQVDELVTALEGRAAEAERLQSALAEERERLAAAERLATEQVAAAEARIAAAEAEAQAAEERAAEERAAAQQEAERRAAEAREAERRAAEEAAAARQLAEAPQIRVAPPPAATDDVASVLTRIEQRQLYMMAAIALIFLLVLLFWLRSRRRPLVIEQPPLLLAAPAPAVSGPAVSAPAPAPLPTRPIIDVPEEPAAARASSTGGRVKIDGVMPQTAEAKAAQKAGAARRGAVEAAARGAAAEGPDPSKLAEDMGSAPLGQEAEAAAHPIVTALRKGNLPLFELLFSELTQLRAPQLQRIVYGGRGEDLVIVCRAVGVDKLLFGSIFLLTDHLRGGSAEEEPERTAEILRMYDRMPPETAQKVLAKWQHNWSGAGNGAGASRGE